MICRRVCKCEPLLRFNPLNLVKIVCFAKWVKGAKYFSSYLILTCIILTIKAQLNQLVNWKLWVALFYPEQSGWILTKFAYFTSISGPRVAPKENSLKKFYRSEFVQSSFIFVIYFLKEAYRKIMSEIYFVGKTRFEDLRDWLC